MLLNDEISEKLKALRLNKGYSLTQMADLAGVTKQGYHLWEQGLRTWKVDTLAQLSDVLGFEIIIKNGQLTIQERVVETLMNYQTSEVESMEFLEKTGLEGYKIITLYTGPANINFQYGDILDEILVYRTPEETMNVFKIGVYSEDDLVRIYALYHEETGMIYERTYALNKTKAYTYYYYHCAPVLDEDNTVYIDTEKDIKVARKYVGLDIHHPNVDGSYPVLWVKKEKTEAGVHMFTVTDMSGSIIPQIPYVWDSFPFE